MRTMKNIIASRESKIKSLEVWADSVKCNRCGMIPKQMARCKTCEYKTCASCFAYMQFIKGRQAYNPVANVHCELFASKPTCPGCHGEFVDDLYDLYPDTVDESCSHFATLCNQSPTEKREFKCNWCTKQVKLVGHDLAPLMEQYYRHFKTCISPSETQSDRPDMKVGPCWLFFFFILICL